MNNAERQIRRTQQHRATRPLAGVASNPPLWILVVYVVILLLATTTTLVLMADRAAFGKENGEAVRVLPAHAVPGTSVTVRLQFDFPELTDLTVRETIHNITEIQFTVRNAGNTTVYYDFTVPEDAEGELTVEGYLPGGQPITGDATVSIVRPDRRQFTAPQSLLPHRLNEYEHIALSVEDSPVNGIQDAVTATYEKDGDTYTAYLAAYDSAASAEQALHSLEDKGGIEQIAPEPTYLIERDGMIYQARTYRNLYVEATYREVDASFVHAVAGVIQLD